LSSKQFSATTSLACSEILELLVTYTSILVTLLGPPHTALIQFQAKDFGFLITVLKVIQMFKNTVK